VGGSADKKVGKAIVVVVLKDDAHAKSILPSLVKAAPVNHRRFRNVPFQCYGKQMIGDVIRHKNIGEAVAIVIGRSKPRPRHFSMRC